jgi:hypothetical protein
MYCTAVNWIRMYQDMLLWRIFVNMVMMDLLVQLSVSFLNKTGFARSIQFVNVLARTVDTVHICHPESC